MAQTDMLKRYLDAGIAFTKVTQERAEAIVRDLVGAGEVASDQASSAVADLVERSRENTERLLETVRSEIATQVGNLGLATRADVDALRDEIAALRAGAAGSSSTSTSTPTPKAPTAKKAAPAAKAVPTSEAGSPVELPATPSPEATAKKVAAKKASPAKKAGAPDAAKAGAAKAGAAKAGPAKAGAASTGAPKANPAAKA